MMKSLKQILNSRENGKIKALPILGFPACSLLGISVKELILSPENQASAILSLAKKYDSLSALCLMDLSIEAECFGAKIKFHENDLPTVSGVLVNDTDDANALEIPSVGVCRSKTALKAAELVLKELPDKPLVAGMIGPYSLAARLMGVSDIMMLCYDEPDAVHTVLTKATEFLKAYGAAFKALGCSGVLVAEPVAGLLSPVLEAEFSSPYMKEITDFLQNDSFSLIYHNCGDNTPRMLTSLLSIGADAYHFGNSVDIVQLIEELPESVCVMGNLDPSSLFLSGSPEKVESATFALLESTARHKNFVLSSGCDIPPLAPLENIDAFYGALKKFNEK